MQGATSKNLSVLNIDPGYKKQVKGIFPRSVTGRHCRGSLSRPSVRSS